MAALEPGRKAPAFELKDLDGKAHSLAELKTGEFGLLVFFHRECPVCQFTIPFIDKLARDVRSPRARIWGIEQDSEEEAEDFARRKDLRMTVLIDDEPYPVSNAYGITNVPTLFLIDSKGAIRKTSVGFARDEITEIAAELARAAKVKPPALFAGRSDIPAFKPG
jgi:peroxiredoxin